MDVARRCERADGSAGIGAGPVGQEALTVPPQQEAFFEFGPGNAGDGTPGCVVVHARRLTGLGDQGDDRERSVWFDVQNLAAVAPSTSLERDAPPDLILVRESGNEGAVQRRWP